MAVSRAVPSCSMDQVGNSSADAMALLHALHADAETTTNSRINQLQSVENEANEAAVAGIQSVENHTARMHAVTAKRTRSTVKRKDACQLVAIDC